MNKTYDFKDFENALNDIEDAFNYCDDGKSSIRVSVDQTAFDGISALGAAFFFFENIDFPWIDTERNAQCNWEHLTIGYQFAEITLAYLRLNNHLNVFWHRNEDGILSSIAVTAKF